MHKIVTKVLVYFLYNFLRFCLGDVVDSPHLTVFLENALYAYGCWCYKLVKTESTKFLTQNRYWLKGKILRKHSKFSVENTVSVPNSVNMRPKTRFWDWKLWFVFNLELVCLIWRGLFHWHWANERLWQSNRRYWRILPVTEWWLRLRGDGRPRRGRALSALAGGLYLQKIGLK